MSKTLQENIHTHNHNTLEEYSLFMGGVDVTHKSLLQYSPLKTGFGRIFMVRKPIVVNAIIPEKLNKVKHIMEYANTGITGLGDYTVDFESMSGSYVGKSIEIPMIVKDDTTAFTIKTFEFSGSPIREVIHTWLTSVSDLHTGLSHYHGVDLEVNQANHTAEFIYIATDQTGKNIEYACQLANCFPKGIRMDHFNYEAGQHSLVPYDIEFSCIRYESPQINELAKILLSKNLVLTNCLDFHSGMTSEYINALPSKQLMNTVNK